MGELLRRYWVPVGVVDDLGDQGKKVRVFGEDLVLFRTGPDAYGLIQEACPHRRASMAYGFADAKGIRCPYHGWQFDAKGRCVDTPPEPEDSTLRESCSITAYPAQALGGLVFAYLGPAPAPLLPRFDLFVWEGVLRDVGWAQLPCNWLQIMENSVDPHHVEWLHGHHLSEARSKEAGRPTHYRRRHARIGFDVFDWGIIKRRVLEGGSEEDDDWKIGHPLVFPMMLRVGSAWQHRFQIRVPIDDTHTMHYWYSVYRPPASKTAPPQDRVPSYEVPWRRDDGEYIVDFVDGQDIMAWVTQGAITDRTKEKLGTSDRGIILFRQLLEEQLKKVEGGADPLGVIRDPSRNQLIELPQEHHKYQAGRELLAESMAMGHVRHSPIRDDVLELFSS